jgi:hypothetical protein
MKPWERTELAKELTSLLEERTMPDFERRQQRLLSIPMDAVGEAVRRGRMGERLTKEQYCVVNLGFLPGEIREREEK